MGIRVLIVSVAAFVVGAIGAFAISGGLSGDDQSPSAVDTTTSSAGAGQVEPTTYFVDPNETLIATTAVVPTLLEITDSAVNLDFEMMSLAPLGELTERDAAREAAGFSSNQPDVPPVYALDWKLIATDGSEIETSIVNSEVTVARFQTESPLTADAIDRIEISRYLVATPFDAVVMLREGATFELFPGVSLTVVGRTGLDNQTAFEVAATAEVPIQSQWIHMSGLGPDWDSSSRENFGGGNWTIAWNSSDLPDEVPVRVVGTAWLLQDEPVALSLEGVR